MYSKFPEISAVMAASKNRLEKITLEYNKSLHSTTLNPELLVDIKAYLADLRSGLDYLNQKIPSSDLYFPICEHPNDFTGRYGRVNILTRNILEKHQPYNKNEWFRWFNVLNNKNKHVTLVPQIRREFIETKVSHPGGGGVSWTSGVIFGSGVSIMGVPIDPKTQLPIPNSTLKTEKITWVDFVFDNNLAPAILPSSLSALPFLTSVFEKIAQIIKEVEMTIS